MNESLGPKEIASAKREGRQARVSRIRKRVAAVAATGVAAFSGLILVETLTASNGSMPKEPAPVTLDGEEIGSRITSVVLDAILPAESSESDSGLTTSQS